MVWYSQGVVYKGLIIPIGTNTKQRNQTPKVKEIHYPWWSEIVGTLWLRHLTDLGVAWQACTTGSGHLVLYHHFTIFITSLLYLARKQISHLSLCHAAIIFGLSHIYLTSHGEMSGQRKDDNIISFFVKRRIEERSQKVNIFCRLIPCPISFELCCHKYIFQVLKIYVIQKKKRWVSVHKTTNA